MNKSLRLIVRILPPLLLFTPLAHAKEGGELPARDSISMPGDGPVQLVQPKPPVDIEAISKKGLQAIEAIMNMTPEQLHESCLQNLREVQAKNRDCLDNGNCDSDSYHLERPDKKDCHMMGYCIYSSAHSIRLPAVVHAHPEKIEKVCLDSNAEIESILTYRFNIYAKTNDGRFGVLHQENSGKCQRTFEPVSSDVTDVFLFNETIYLTKRNPAESAKAGKPVSGLFEVQVTFDESRRKPDEILAPPAFKLVDKSVLSSEKIMSERGRLHVTALGSKERKPIESIAPYDGGVQYVHDICFHPDNFPDGKIPKDDTGVVPRAAR